MENGWHVGCARARKKLNAKSPAAARGSERGDRRAGRLSPEARYVGLAFFPEPGGGARAGGRGVVSAGDLGI